MNPVNATTLYVSVCRSLMKCDPQDPQSLAELFKLLPFFKQSLTCLVCGNLLKEPMAPTNSSCQHYVCKACKGKKMDLKPSCSWCKDYEQFEENKQLSILVDCYKQLFEYIAQSSLAHHIASSAGDCPEMSELLKEGLSLTEKGSDEPRISLSLSLLHSPTPSPTTVDCGTQVEPPAGLQEPLPEARVLPTISDGPGDDAGLGEDQPPASIVPSPDDASAPVAMSDGTGLGEDKPADSSVPSPGWTSEPVAMHDGAELGEEQLAAGSVPSPDRTSEPVAIHDSTGLGEEQPAASSVPPPDSTSAPVAMHDGEGPTPQGISDGPAADVSDGPVADVDAELGGGKLLLSVEEVLQSLDPCPAAEGNPETLPGTLGNPNGFSQPAPAPEPKPLAPCHPQTPFFGISCSAATPRTVRPNRKRSRSESDSEKIQPLPIANIIQGPPSTAAVAPVMVEQEPSIPAQPTATDGSVPEAGNLSLVSSKCVRKNTGSAPKRLYTRTKPTVPRTKDRSKDSHPGNSLESTRANKAVCKKPPEKKGCKCGRATQTPSVLTCRGQRCPCYSNRKACLDCICRGCQNSYMANGEKKLEAFAVPEKALEQTRLTLGINVTSIAVRNAGANSGVLNVSSSSPVSAFLAAGSHEGNIFDENLDIRF